MCDAEPCPLCRPSGEMVVWAGERCRVVLVDETGYPGFCRAIWHGHVREMTDLTAGDRGHLMAVVFAVEAALREVLAPSKVNLASLGNRVPHLHWHVIPRFEDDPHFPDAVWGPALRPAPLRPSPDPHALASAIGRHLAAGVPAS